MVLPLFLVSLYFFLVALILYRSVRMPRTHRIASTEVIAMKLFCISLMSGDRSCLEVSSDADDVMSD